MAQTRTPTRSDYVRVLPTFQDAAVLIEMHRSGITRAVTRLGIEPQMWGGSEKHLEVRDLLRIAEHARRASVEEVAGGLLELVEGRDPRQLPAIQAELERYFTTRAQAEPAPRDAFLAELREALPRKYADRAERIYRRYVDSS